MDGCIYEILAQFGNAEYSNKFFNRVNDRVKKEMAQYEKQEHEQKKLVARKLGNIA